VVVALSGGGDSTALLHMLSERLGPQRLIAGIVDHGLRVGAIEEARRAADWAGQIGVQARISTLAWKGSPRRAQAALRRRRYAALCAMARASGAELIAVAHTADDQAETVFMRAMRGSDWRGLAGMAPLAPAPLWPEGRGLRIARPLLDRRRTELRAWLSARRLRWIEDPSNEIEAYERVRARRKLATLEQKGLALTRLAGLAVRLRPLVESLDGAAAAWLAQAAIEEGAASLRRAAVDGSAAAAYGLAALIAAVSGADAPPPSGRVATLAAASAQRDFRGATLGGARIAVHGDKLLIRRDPGGVLGRAGVAPAAPLLLPAGEPAIWDGRVWACASEPGWRLEAAGSGADPAAPRLRNGRRVLTLGEGRGVVASGWLISAHVKHLLPAFRARDALDVKMGC
jgi:tRNA(Ile)-lysidine synthase